MFQIWSIPVYTDCLQMNSRLTADLLIEQFWQLSSCIIRTHVGKLLMLNAFDVYISQKNMSQRNNYKQFYL